LLSAEADVLDDLSTQRTDLPSNQGKEKQSNSRFAEDDVSSSQNDDVIDVVSCQVVSDETDVVITEVSVNLDDVGEVFADIVVVSQLELAVVVDVASYVESLVVAVLVVLSVASPVVEHLHDEVDVSYAVNMVVLDSDSSVVSLVVAVLVSSVVVTFVV